MIPAWLANAVQLTPSVTSAHLLQLAGDPGIVGPGGVGFVVVVVGLVVVVGGVVEEEEEATPTQ